MVKGISNMFVTGPDVVRAALGQQDTFEELGGAEVHSTKSGVADFVTENEQDAFTLIRRLLSYLPENNSEPPPRVKTDDPADRRDESLRQVIPDDPRQPYDRKDVLTSGLDKGVYHAVHGGSPRR